MTRFANDRSVEPGRALEFTLPVRTEPLAARGGDGSVVPTQVLVVEDDEDLRGAIRQYLSACGCSVKLAADGKSALTWLLCGPVDVVVLDLMLPVMDGLELCRQLRGAGSAIPVLMATALGSLEHRLAGLRVGADDYLVKPFSLEELSLRVFALARRTGFTPTAVLQSGDLVLEVSEQRASRGGVEIELTRRETQLLELFLRRPGLVVSREQMQRAIFGSTGEASDNLLDQYVAHLRRKVDHPFGRRNIETVRRVGYRFRVTP